jgi:hypothetical protein
MVTRRRLSTYIDALVPGRRPPDFRADPDDLEVLRTAIALRAARPGDANPDEEFVSDLYEELAGQASPQSAPMAHRPAPRRGRAVLAAVAATIALVAGTVGATEAVHRTPGTPGTALVPHAGDVRTGTFETADNQVTGQIVAYGGHPSWVSMNVDGSNYSGPIVCTLQVENGSTVAVGVFDLRGGKGEFSRSITANISRLRGAKLVTPTGSIVALATFA